MNELLRLIAQHPCLQWSTDQGHVAFVPYQPAQDEAATHAYAVPFVAGGACIVTRRDTGRWTLPGGTRISGESWHDTLRRELLEETGSTVDEHQPFGAFRLDNGQNQTFRIVALAVVTRVQQPADPDGRQGIVEVREAPLEQAVRLFDDGLVQYGAVYAIAGALWTLRGETVTDGWRRPR